MDAMVGDTLVRRFDASSVGTWQRVAGAHLSPVRVHSPTRSWSAKLVAVTTSAFQFAALEASSHHVVWDDPERFPSGAHRVRLIRLGDGRGRVMQDGRVAELGAGDFAFYDDARPYRLELDTNFQSVLLAFPAEHLDVPPPALSRLTAVSLGGGSGIERVASGYLGDVADELDDIQAPEWPGAHRATLELLTSALIAQLGVHRALDAEFDEFLAACEWIEAHLSDPGLTSLRVAELMYTSRRRLQQIFKDAGTTVAEHIRARRLERARRVLDDAARSDVTIAQIAYECGIDNPAYFSRIFSEQFGMSPREYRTRSRASLAA